MNTDPRVDAYIANAAPFAQPLLAEMRKRIRETCPDAIETIKWNVPFYELSGKLLASMAAFKKHTKFGIWLDMRPEMVDAITLGDLPSPTDYAKKLKRAAEHARLVGGPGTKKATSKKPVNPASVKKDHRPGVGQKGPCQATLEGAVITGHRARLARRHLDPIIACRRGFAQSSGMLLVAA